MQFNNLLPISYLFKPLNNELIAVIPLDALTATRINNDIAVAMQSADVEEQQSLTQQKCTWSD